VVQARLEGEAPAERTDSVQEELPEAQESSNADAVLNADVTEGAEQTNSAAE